MKQDYSVKDILTAVDDILNVKSTQESKKKITKKKRVRKKVYEDREKTKNVQQWLLGRRPKVKKSFSFFDKNRSLNMKGEGKTTHTHINPPIFTINLFADYFLA